MSPLSFSIIICVWTCATVKSLYTFVSRCISNDQNKPNLVADVLRYTAKREFDYRSSRVIHFILTGPVITMIDISFGKVWACHFSSWCTRPLCGTLVVRSWDNPSLCSVPSVYLWPFPLLYIYMKVCYLFTPTYDYIEQYGRYSTTRRVQAQTSHLVATKFLDLLSQFPSVCIESSCSITPAPT